MKLKAEKYITSMKAIDITIEGINLLSVEEYLKARDHIKPINERWWLRSPGYYSNSAAYVSYAGGVNVHGLHVDNNAISVCPSIHFKSDDLSISEQIRFGNYDWTVIGEGLALCDTAFCKMAFRRDLKGGDANVYEKSDINSYLTGWLREQELLIEAAGKIQDDEESLKAVQSGCQPDMEERKPTKRHKTR